MIFKTLVCAILLALSSNSFAQGFMAVANVSKIHGTAFINKEKIKVGAEIAEGMKLSIPNPKDFVEVKFQNGHLVRFTGANVVADIINPKETFFNLIKGKMFSIIKPMTSGETFQVKTTRASFGVRGTKFLIEENKKQTYLCVCDGVVFTKSKTGEVEVKKDEDLSLAKVKSELKATVAAKSMVDMTNAVFNEMGN